MPDGLVGTEEERVLERIVRNNLKIAELTAENEVFKDFFKASDAYPAGLKKEVGKFFIKITGNTRIDNGLAIANLEPALYDKVCKKSIDSALAKKVLTPEQYQKTVRTFANKVEVGIV